MESLCAKVLSQSMWKLSPSFEEMSQKLFALRSIEIVDQRNMKNVTIQNSWALNKIFYSMNDFSLEASSTKRVDYFSRKRFD